MSIHFDLASVQDVREISVDVASRLAQSEVLLLTIDSGIVLVAWSQRPAAVERIAQFAGEEAPLGLGLSGYHQARDYVPRHSVISKRLMTRCWPGPLQVVFPIHAPEGLLAALPSSVRTSLMGHQELSLLCPKSPFFRDLQKLLSGPLVLTSPLGDDKLSALKPDTSDASKSSVCDVVVANGHPRFSQQGLTVVKFERDDWSILRAGAIPPTNLKRMSGTFILFVCTGNTCRSPMAEGIFRKMLADRLQCDQDELSEQGYLVLSAGISASDGNPAAKEAVQLLAEEGIDLSSHSSRQLTEALLDQADLVLTLTHGHRNAILASRPDLDEAVHLLSPSGMDIPDPIGGGLAEYQACKQEIERALNEVVERIHSVPGSE
jgi:L-threonylcarbamoyladenylate synthase